MKALLNFFLLLSITFTLTSCINPLTDGDIEKNLRELDKVYGKCNNPRRYFTKVQLEICRAQQRAAGPDGVIGDPINLEGVLDRVRGGTVVTASDTNNFLWDASLQVLSPYSLKIMDFEGGFIETNWIKDSAVRDQRCLIKSHITSPELVSNGVKINIVCEKLVDNEWYVASQDFSDDEKQLILKILNEASILSLANKK